MKSDQEFDVWLDDLNFKVDLIQQTNSIGGHPGYGLTPEEFEEILEDERADQRRRYRELKCECGAEAAGLNHHAHWCDLYQDPTISKKKPT